MVVVIPITLVFSREERCIVTIVCDWIVGSDAILILSLDYFLTPRPCLLWMNHCDPVHSKSTFGSDVAYHVQSPMHCLYCVQCPSGWKRNRFPSENKSRNIHHVFHQAVGVRY
jgi:hypothetical protein